MTDIFISYSRKDAEFMRLLHGKLQAAERDVWVDWEDIPATADWWSEIKGAIEAADAFAFIISSNSVRSDICRQEIQHAIDNNKRFIPLLYKETTEEDASFIHPAIRSHNWIPFNDPEKYDESVQKLIEALSTDPDYLRRHTRLLVRGKEWVQNKRHPSYLLKGAELNEYQAWLLESQRLQPKPNELQLEYILASQSARSRNQLRLAFAGIVAALVFTAMVAFALLQNQTLREAASASTLAAAEQFSTSQAQSTQIAAQATNIANIRSDSRSLLTQAYIQNTLSALQSENLSLRETLTYFEAFSLASPSATATLAAVFTPTDAGDSGIEPENSPTAAAGAGLSPTQAEDSEAVEASPSPTAPSDMGLEPENSPTPNEAEAQSLPTATIFVPAPTMPIPTRLPDTVAGPRADYFVNPYGDNQADCQNPDSACLSIGAALVKASDGDTIEIAPGVYDENLLIDKSLTLQGLEADNTVLNGNFAGRVITVQADVTVTIENLMITGGTAAYGGGILNLGELRLNNVVVVGNFADLAGGSVANFGDLEATNSDFSENYAPAVAEIYNAGTAQGAIDGVAIAPVNSAGTLGMNVLVLINTTDGDVLNMRSEPDLQAAVVERIQPETPALIIGDSQAGDGFTWWLISLQSGQTGWVVENVDNIQVVRPLE